MTISEQQHVSAAPSTPLEWAVFACDSIMRRFTPQQLPPANRWHYHQGVFLQGMEKVWRATGDEKYLAYIRDYVNLYVDEQGGLEVKDHLDDIMPGQLLLLLDEQFDDPRYRKCADMLRGLLDTWKTTPDGGFWHKDIYPNQMWLDGIYMAGPFAVKYAVQYGDASLFDLVAKQALLMNEHMTDQATGLLYHGWDATKSKEWADPETGCSPEFWGRSVGWYGFALAEVLDYFPANHPARSELIAILQRVAKAEAGFQNGATGLWYQIVDKGGNADNWLELSCSTLFVYTIAKAVRDGLLDRSYLAAVHKGYEGVLSRIGFEADGTIIVPDVCMGTSVGTYDYYINRERKVNDLHGMATFLHMCMELHLGGV